MAKLSLTAGLLLLTLPSTFPMGDSLDEDRYKRVRTGIYPGSYGVDCSFPIHHKDVNENYSWLPEGTAENAGSEASLMRSLNQAKDKIKSYVGSGSGFDPSALANPLSWEQKSNYEQNMKGCAERYNKKVCEATERDRIAMNLRQPASMTNYTELGFAKVMLPSDLFDEIKDFWEKYKDSGRVAEEWPSGNTYTNHWKTPTHMVNFENRKLRGGMDMKNKIWSGAREILEAWVDQELTATSLYGIRVYSGGHVLAPHVDRLPLVVSCIINVDQDVEEPWPLEVYAHNGVSYNVTIEPGEMILYESHSVIHGRPFEMKGNFMANVFVHFEPNGHTLRHQEKTRVAREELENAKKGGKTRRELDDEYALKAKNQQGGGHEHFQYVDGDDANDDFEAKAEQAAAVEDTDDLDTYRPGYILKGSEEDNRWRSTYLRTHKVKSPDTYENAFTGSNAILSASQRGDLAIVQREVERAHDPVKAVNTGDENGWGPLHEAARGGHTDVAKYLVDKGADINKKTASGHSAARLAKNAHDESHPIYKWFIEMGGTDVGPEL